MGTMEVVPIQCYITIDFPKLEQEVLYERYYSGGGIRNQAVSPDKGSVQADHAGVRQAHDLLSAVHTDAGGNPGGTDHLDAQRYLSV